MPADKKPNPVQVCFFSVEAVVQIPYALSKLVQEPGVKECVPGFMAALYLYKKQYQKYSCINDKYFLQEEMTRMFRTLQSIQQVLRDTFVRPQSHHYVVLPKLFSGN